MNVGTANQLMRSVFLTGRNTRNHADNVFRLSLASGSKSVPRIYSELWGSVFLFQPPFHQLALAFHNGLWRHDRCFFGMRPLQYSPQG